MEGGGFEPPKAEPPDLQSGPFDRSGTPPQNKAGYSLAIPTKSQRIIGEILIFFNITFYDDPGDSRAIHWKSNR